MKNQQINLLPNERILRHKRSVATVRWTLAGTLTLLVCGVLNAGFLLTEKNQSNILIVRASEQKIQIGNLARDNAALQEELKRLSTRAEAVSMLDRRIDWRGIFSGISYASDPNIRFMQIQCSTVSDGGQDRVEILTQGFAESQTLARSFAVALEEVRLFDQVVLEATDRVVIDDSEFVRFQIRLVVDPELAEAGGEP